MDGPFNVGTLIATLKLEGAPQFRSDLAAARADYQSLGRSAKASGDDVDSGQRKGAKATSEAAATSKAAARDVEASAKTATKATEEQGTATERTAEKVKDAGEATKTTTTQTEQGTVAANKYADAVRAHAPAIVTTKDRMAALRVELGAVRDEWANMTAEQQGAARDVAATGAVISGAITGLAVTAVAKFASFDAAFSSVRANVQGSAEDFKLLRQAAIDAGGDTQYTAEEAAKAQNELGKAGVSTAAILSGGLRGALALAASGQVEVADAAETAATAMTQFRLSGEEVPHLADLLAAGAAKAQGGVTDLSYALRQSGLVASQFGLSVEETIGGLTAFASAGLLGSDAGTSFRTMLLSLANPSTKSAAAMREYNIEAYDAQGNFVGLAALAEQLKTGFDGATQAQRDQALATIFGTDAIRGANVLYEQGRKGIVEWTRAVDDQGFAQKQAAELTDNLTGDLERLGGAFDSAMIIAGEGANGPLRDMVQMITALVDGYTELPPVVQQGGLILGGIVGVAGLAASAFLAAAVQVTQLRANMTLLNGSAPTTRAALSSLAGFLGANGPLGLGLIAVTALVGGFIQRQMEARGRVDALRQSLNAQTGELTKYSRELIQAQLAQDPDFWDMVFNPRMGGSIYDRAESIGVSLDTITQAAEGSTAALDELRAMREGAEGDFARWRELNGLVNDVENLAEETGNAKDQQEQLNRAEEAGAESAATLAEELTNVEGVTRSVTEAEAERMSELADADAAFVSFGDAMTTVQEKGKALAEQTAADTESSKDSWEDYYDGVTVSTEGILEELRRQVEAQTNWESNMLALAGRVSQGTIDELARLGPEGAPLVAELVTASDAELAEMEQLYHERSAAATNAFADNLTRAAPVLAALAGVAGQGVADETARKLAEGTTTLEQIVNDWKLTVEGFVPVVQIDTATALSKLSALRQAMLPTSTTWKPGDGPVMLREAQGGVVDYYAQGGVREQHVAQIAGAGAWRVWAEPETGGEAYIPLSAAKRSRSEAILDDVARRFGGRYMPPGAQAFADGALVGAGTGVRSATRSAPYIGEVNFLNGDADALDELVMRLMWQDRDGLNR